MSSSTSGRRRTTDRHYSAEDQALDQISKEAEERIQARRQARAEAREIRLKEIERQQKEEEDKQKAISQGVTEKSISNFSGSRRGSNDSTDTDASSKDSRDPKDHLRDLKHQLRELEDKYKQAMVTNAQLDNVKTSHVFQLELLKEQLEEQEETMLEVQREYKDKCREYELMKRDFDNMKQETEGIKQMMDIKDKLLQESGLTIVASDEGELSLTKCTDLSKVTFTTPGTSLLSDDSANLLKKAGEGTLGKNEHDDNRVTVLCDDDRVTVLDNNDRVTVLDNNDRVTVLCDDNRVTVLDNIDRVTVLDNNDKVEVNRNDNKNDEVSDVGKGESDVKDVKDGKKEIGDETIQKDKSNSISDEVDSCKEEMSCGNLDDKLGHQIDENDGKEVDKMNIPICNSLADINASFKEGSAETKTSLGELSEGDENDGNENDMNAPVCESVSEANVCFDVGSVDTKGEVGGVDELSESEDEDGEEVFFESKSEIVDSPVDNDGDAGMERSNSLCGEFKLGVRLEREQLMSNFSCISMESDVTYHRESEDEFDQRLESADFVQLKPESITTAVNSDANEMVENDENNQEANSPERFQSCNDNGENDKGEGEISDSVRAKLESMKMVGTREREEFDEVFNSIPDDFHGCISNEPTEVEVKKLVKNFVNDVIGKSVDKIREESLEEKVLLRNMSSMSHEIDISVSKRHYSVELLDEVSPFVRQSVHRGSIDILTPLTTIESAGDENHLKFFGFKVDTDADVVLTSIEDSVAGDPRISSLSSDPVSTPPVSGFGIYFVGDNSELNKDSVEFLSPLSDEFPVDALDIDPSFQMPEIISMEVNLEDEGHETDKNELEDTPNDLKENDINQSLNKSGTDKEVDINESEIKVDEQNPQDSVMGESQGVSAAENGNEMKSLRVEVSEKVGNNGQSVIEEERSKIESEDKTILSESSPEMSAMGANLEEEKVSKCETSAVNKEQGEEKKTLDSTEEVKDSADDKMVNKESSKADNDECVLVDIKEENGETVETNTEVEKEVNTQGTEEVKGEDTNEKVKKESANVDDESKVDSSAAEGDDSVLGDVVWEKRTKEDNEDANEKLKHESSNVDDKEGDADPCTTEGGAVSGLKEKKEEIEQTNDGMETISEEIKGDSSKVENDETMLGAVGGEKGDTSEGKEVSKDKSGDIGSMKRKKKKKNAKEEKEKGSKRDSKEECCVS